MKRIILILICLFITTGCYDYIEINDLSFISSIGIDYKDEEYNLTFEILNDTKNGSEQASQKSYTISAKGNTLAKAFDNASLKIAKVPYFYHLKAIVISEDIAKYHTKEVIEYVTRDTEIRNGFYLVIAKDVTAEKIINNANENNPVVGNQITKLIETNKKYYNITYPKTFEDILEKFQNDKIDSVISVITLENNDIKALGIGTFDGYQYQSTLSQLDSGYLNILIGEANNILVQKKYNKKPVSVNLFDGKTKYNFENNKIIIDITIDAEIKENMPEFDLRNDKTYQELSKDFSSLVTKDIQNLIDIIKKNNTDILGLENLYYKKYRQSKKNILDYDIEVNAIVKINKRGLIYELS